MKNFLKIMLVIFLALFLFGCTPTAVSVKKISKKVLWSRLVEYTGLNGYNIAYQNYESGKMRIVTSINSTPSTTQTYGNVNAYGRSAFGTSTAISYGGKVEAHAVIVKMTQSGKDVILVLDGKMDLENPPLVNGFLDELKKDYKIEVLESSRCCLY